MAEHGSSFFVGEYFHSVDDKGRITVPSKWRIPGDDRRDLYLALPNPGGYVTVYPPHMIARLEEKVGEFSMGDVRGQELLMEVFSKAHQFGCDKQGRINLNDKLLAHGGIRKNAVLVGNFTTFSIWSQGKYETRAPATAVNVLEAMKELGI